MLLCEIYERNSLLFVKNRKLKTLSPICRKYMFDASSENPNISVNQRLFELLRTIRTSVWVYNNKNYAPICAFATNNAVEKC